MTASKQDVIFYGGPGAGKTTQATLLTKSLKAHHVSMGEALRAIGQKRNRLGNLIRATVQSGTLLDNKTTLEIIKPVIDAAGNKTILFDGFPRNLVQAKALDKFLATKGRKAIMVYLEVPTDVVIERLRKRGRADDIKPEVIRTRIRIFKNNSKKLLAYFKDKGSLMIINGDNDMKKINKEILQKLK